MVETIETKSVGKVVQVIGPVVDVRFPDENLPNINNAVIIEEKAKGINLTAEVAQHLGDNVVRCVAMATTDGLVRGMEAHDTGKAIMVPVGKETLGRILDLLGRPIDGLERWRRENHTPSIATRRVLKIRA